MKMSLKGKYLYGIIRTDKDETFGDIGIQGGKVYTLRYKDIAALVSDLPFVGKIKPLKANLGPHNQVIKELTRRFTVIPMTFGHIAKSEDDILRMLKLNYDEINAELERLQGKVEMGLKVFWDVDNIFEYFVKKYRELEDFRDEIFGRSSQPTRQEMIELGRLFEEKLGEEREHHTEKVIDVLRDYVLDFKVNEPIGEKMAVNSVFLIERDKEKAFEEAIYKAASLFDGNFTFDYNGPWAPYNFVELELET